MGTEQRFALQPKYKGFLKNKDKILNINAAPEAVFTADLIYLRYAAAFALTRINKEQISALRGAFSDLSMKGDTIKAVLANCVNASLRVFKLARFYNAVFQGLGDSLRIFELNHKTAQNVDLLLEVNFASALILKTFTSALDPNKYIFLSSVCKITLEHIARIRPFFAQLGDKGPASLGPFLEVAEVFYRCMMLHIAIKLNNFEDRGLVKRTKDFKVNYVENRTLANELFKLVGELEKKSFKNADQWNVEANRLFAVNFLKKIAFEDAQT